MFYNPKTKPNNQYEIQAGAKNEVHDVEGANWNLSVRLSTINPPRNLDIGAS